jgi:hypothetical protein
MQMKTRTPPILLAVVSLIAATLACSVGGDLSLTNFRAAHDQNGEQVASVFSPTDTVYIVADLSNAPTGTMISSKWFAVDAEGMDPNALIDEAEITTDQESFSGTVYFYFPPSSPWPVGSYTVEIYLNGQIAESVPFTVQ